MAAKIGIKKILQIEDTMIVNAVNQIIYINDKFVKIVSVRQDIHSDNYIIQIESVNPEDSSDKLKELLNINRFELKISVHDLFQHLKNRRK